MAVNCSFLYFIYSYNVVMRKKGKVKVMINDDFDSESDVSPGEYLNDASSTSNDESEIAKQLAHDNGHKFSLIMERIAALEAENAHLQTYLNKGTSEMKTQQATSDAESNKRKPNTLDSSDDTSDGDLKVIPRQKKVSKHVRSGHHLSGLSVDEHEVLIFTVNIF